MPNTSATVITQAFALHTGLIVCDDIHVYDKETRYASVCIYNVCCVI